jgi:hypothetical protein
MRVALVVAGKAAQRAIRVHVAAVLGARAQYHKPLGAGGQHNAYPGSAVGFFFGYVNAAIQVAYFWLGFPIAAADGN